MFLQSTIFRKILNKRKVGKSKVDIKQPELANLLDNKLPEHKRLMLDGKYKIPHIDDLKNAINETVIDETKYRSNTFDCENMSMYFHSILALEYGYNGCGIVLSYPSEHAFNILVSHKGDKNSLQVHIFEPQSDSMWLPNIKKDKYIVKDQIILI